MRRLCACVLLAAVIGSCVDKQTVTVYFLDEQMLASGTTPYEKPVERTIPVNDNVPRAVLEQYFLGPTQAEQQQGLAPFLSGATGFSQLRVEDGVAHVYLTGPCDSGGSAVYTIANPIFANLLQFPEIRWVKIYDEDGTTDTPTGQSNSIPACLEP